MEERQMRILLVCLLTLLLLGSTAVANERALEGSVETRIGKLEFDKGYPTDNTVEKLYNEMDFQRACQAYLWALPLVEMAEWKRAHNEDFGGGNYDLVTYMTGPEKMGILTANATTPYIIGFINLKETGPLVYELPAGPTAGGFMDFWQRPITDLGQTGPDKGNGAKVLLLGPGHEDMNPEGYMVFRSPTWHVMLASRVLVPDPVEAKKLIDAHKLYSYSKKDEKPTTKIISAKGIVWAAHQPRGLAYFERMAEVLKIEPVEDRDRMMMAKLRFLGIEPGKDFTPSDRQKKILTEAALVGEAMARANGYAKRFEGARLWDGKRWEKALFLEETNQELPTHTQLDERSAWFYEAIGVSEGMMGKIVGAGQVYLETMKDKAGNWLDGGKNYKLTVPANAPVKQFWSFTVYDNDTRCLIQNGGRSDLSSRMDLATNADGSVDLYFGPEEPKNKDHAKNWVKTVPGEGWFTYFRLYAPTEAYFDKSWQLPDIEKLTP
jgi:hypothetical protein